MDTVVIRFLSGYALPILATALVLTATSAGVQTWRIGALQAKKGELNAEIKALKADVKECTKANASNLDTIDALVAAAIENAQQYEKALGEARRAALRAQELETELAERAADDIQTIQATDDACGHAPMPDVVRLRLAPRDHQDGRSPGDRGAAGSG